MDSHRCRAARALLDLSQDDLARKAGLGRGAVISFESGGSAHASTVARLRGALENAGAIFRDDGSVISAEQVLDNFAKLARPTSAQKAEAVIAAQRLAAAGGRQEPISDIAAAFMRADRKRRGEED